MNFVFEINFNIIFTSRPYAWRWGSRGA